MFINQIKVGIRNLIKQFYNNSRQYKQLREQADLSLHDFVQSYNNFFKGTVIVDASWDNPNYWLRYSIIRAALGLDSGNEIGLLGQFRRKEQGGTLKRLGINNIFDFFAKSQEFSTLSMEIAKKLCHSLGRPEDILKWSLPFDIPPDFLYDYILKKQRWAFVKVDDTKLLNYVQYFLDNVFTADYAIKKYKPELVISSHAIGNYLPLAWLALKNGVKVIVPFGDTGLFRPWQIQRTSEIYNCMTRLTYKMFLKLSENQKCLLRELGKKCLDKRMNGKTDNLGATYAYVKRNKRVNKKQICSQFNWDEGKRIIAVYASNWFDFPHATGISNFRDFHDWLLTTLEKAKENRNVNWLFKAHPCDEWYGGLTFEDIINVDEYDHIKLACKDWQGAAMLNAIDGIITYHGTIGLEATSLGIPVMVADKGWYHDWEFVKVSNSIEEYLQLLKENWWEGMDLIKNAELSQIFAGCYWGRPSWQKKLLLEDDSQQWEIYKNIPDLLRNNKEEIEKEIELIRKWFESNFQHYHVYKMINSDKYIA